MNIKQFKKHIETTFDDVSSRYDKNKFFSISASNMVDLIPSKDEMNVLDVSTGTGAIAIEVAKRYPHANVEGIDLSSGMLNQAKIKSHNVKLSNIAFKQYDVENLPYKYATFDVVTCGYALFFYPDMEASYQAICKTIKPNGLLIFSSFTEAAFTPYADIFLQRLAQNYNIEAPSKLKERLTTESKIRKLAATSNPKNIDVKYQKIRYSISIDEWWALLNNAGYKSLIDQLGEEQLIQFKQEHLAEIDAISTNGMIELNTDTLFGVVNI